MDSEYLKKNIGDALADGLTAVVLAQPDDPIDYLSQWLFKHVENIEREKNSVLVGEEIEKESARLASLKEEREKARLLMEAAEAAKAADVVAFAECGEDCTSPQQVHDRFVELLHKRIHNAAAYIAAVESLDDDQKRLVYTSASTGQQFLKYQTLEPGQGVSLQAMAAADEPEAELDEKPAYEPSTFFVDNVLLGDNHQAVHFFGKKDVGSFLAIHLQYETLLNAEAMDLPDGEFSLPILPTEAPVEEDATEGAVDAEGPEGEQDAEAEAEAVAEEEVAKPEPPRTKRDLIIGLDTLGLAAELSTADIEEAKRLVVVLRDVLVHVDMKAFLAERTHRKRILEAQQEFEQQSAVDKEEEEKKLKEEVGDMAPVLERIEFLKLQRYLVSKSSLLLEWSSLQMPKGAPVVLDALLRVLSIELPKGASPHLLIDSRCLSALASLDASSITLDEESITSLLGDVDVDAVQADNFLLAKVLQFVQAAVSLSKRAREVREQAQADALAAAEAQAAPDAEADAGDGEEEENSVQEPTEEQ